MARTTLVLLLASLALAVPAAPVAAPFVRAAAASWDSASWDSASWDSASWDSASWDSASWDSASWDSASWDSASWDSASWDSASWDSASWDSASWDSASWDSASWDSASWDSASWDSASWDGMLARGALAPPWGARAIRAPEAWQAGVGDARPLVCVVDSGIDARHPALQGSLWRSATGAVGRDFVEDDDVPQDPAGHGTHIAAIVAGHAPGWPFPGVSRALVASARVLDEQGHGETRDLVDAVRWCASIDADIILLALTEDAPTPDLRRAVQAAAKEGALLVASAGNGGPCRNCVAFPAAYPEVLAVGAFGPDAKPAAFSNAGSRVDVWAPGVAITSAYPGGTARTASGTSQAAAFAAGAAAFVWGLDPSLDAKEVRRALLETTRDIGDVKDALDMAAAAGAVR